MPDNIAQGQRVIHWKPTSTSFVSQYLGSFKYFNTIHIGSARSAKILKQVVIITLTPGEECEGNAFGYVCLSVCLSKSLIATFVIDVVLLTYIQMFTFMHKLYALLYL